MLCFVVREELELEKIKLERVKINKLNSRDSNGVTPHDAQSPKKPKDYFMELRDHIEETNDSFRYRITRANYSMKVWDGDDIVHQVNFTDVDDYIPKVRNLYLMFFDSQYQIETFLEKRDSGAFDNFDGFNPKRDTPPQKSHGS